MNIWKKFPVYLSCNNGPHSNIHNFLQKYAEYISNYNTQLRGKFIQLLILKLQNIVSDLIVLSELPLTTSRSLYWRHAMPRLCPFRVLTNSHVEVFHTLMVRSPEAETIYFSSKSTTFTAARCPTSTRRNVISVCDVISQTAIERSCNIISSH